MATNAANMMAGHMADSIKRFMISLLLQSPVRVCLLFGLAEIRFFAVVC